MAINFENVANYTLYVGLNDKETYTQLVSDDFAMDIVRDTVTNIVGGATFTKSYGHWVDEFGNETNETSIVVEIMGTDDAHIERICSSLNYGLNQNCIMVKKSVSQIAFV